MNDTHFCPFLPCNISPCREISTSRTHCVQGWAIAMSYYALVIRTMMIMIGKKRRKSGRNSNAAFCGRSCCDTAMLCHDLSSTLLCMYASCLKLLHFLPFFFLALHVRNTTSVQRARYIWLLVNQRLNLDKQISSFKFNLLHLLLRCLLIVPGGKSYHPPHARRFGRAPLSWRPKNVYVYTIQISKQYSWKHPQFLTDSVQTQSNRLNEDLTNQSIDSIIGAHFGSGTEAGIVKMTSIATQVDVIRTSLKKRRVIQFIQLPEARCCSSLVQKASRARTRGRCQPLVFGRYISRSFLFSLANFLAMTAWQ